MAKMVLFLKKVNVWYLKTYSIYVILELQKKNQEAARMKKSIIKTDIKEALKAIHAYDATADAIIRESVLTRARYRLQLALSAIEKELSRIEN